MFEVELRRGNHRRGGVLVIGDREGARQGASESEIKNTKAMG